MILTQVLQQRDRTIYLIAAATLLVMTVWRRLPARGVWLYIRPSLLAWVIAVEWLLILVR